MVDRREHPGDVIGLGIAGRDRPAEADTLGSDRKRGQQRERLRPARRAVADRRREVVAVKIVDRQLVGDEQHVELGGFGLCGEAPVETEALVRAARLWMTPATVVNPVRGHEQCKVHLAGHSDTPTRA